jgi:hypothetical protein
MKSGKKCDLFNLFILGLPLARIDAQNISSTTLFFKLFSFAGPNRNSSLIGFPEVIFKYDLQLAKLFFFSSLLLSSI